jgi:hypothetical protein
MLIPGFRIIRSEGQIDRVSLDSVLKAVGDLGDY